MLRFGVCWMVFILFFGVSGVVSAVDYHVSSPQALQTALTTAGENSQDDCIFLSEGTYTGGFSYATTTANDLLLAAEDGLDADDVLLDGVDQERVMTIELVDGASLTVSNLTFAHGRVAQDSPYDFDEGAGLYVQDGRIITLSGCVIRDCHSHSSGAAMSTKWWPSEIHLLGCTFISNRTDYAGSGGALELNATNLIVLSTNIIAYNRSAYAGGGLSIGMGSTARGLTHLQGNRIVGNQQAYGCDMGGGAAYIQSASNIVIEANVIEKNTAGSRGGGLYIGSCKTFVLADNLIRGNLGVFDGGGLYTTCSDIDIHGNRFEENIVKRGSCAGVTGYSHGGAIAMQYAADVWIYNNVIVNNANSNNWYGGEGGGIHCQYNNNAEFLIVNNTIAGNQGYGNGGGLFLELESDDTLSLYNNIIWGNSSTGLGVDVFVMGVAQTKDAYYNNMQGVAALWDHSVSNIDVAPQFMAPDVGDYQLQDSSACVDAGYNSAPGLPITDFDGYSRIDNGTVDMGAYEQSTTAYHPADVNTDWSVSEAEHANYAAAWKQASSWGTGPAPIPMTYATRAGYLTGSGGTYHNQGGGRPLCWETGTGN